MFTLTKQGRCCISFGFYTVVDEMIHLIASALIMILLAEAEMIFINAIRFIIAVT